MLHRNDKFKQTSTPANVKVAVQPWGHLQVITRLLHSLASSVPNTCVDVRALICRAIAVGALALGSKTAMLLKSGGGLAKVGALLVAGVLGKVSVLFRRKEHVL